MITIGAKNKILLFDISTDGIDNENLEFWFRIHCEGVTYSFKGELVEDNKVKIIILPLTEMVRPRFLDFNRVYHANLEIIGDGKYSLTTWEGDIQLEAPPRIDVKLENVQEEKIRKVVKENVKTSKKVIKEDIEVEKPPIKVKISEPVEKPIEKHESIKESEYDENFESTRTSLLEDILGTSKKKKTVITKINDLIKE